MMPEIPDPLEFPKDEWDWIEGTRLPVDPSPDPLENDKMPDGRRLLRREIKLEMRMVVKRERAGESLKDGLPGPGESHHVISNALYDFWNVIAEAITKLGGVAEFYGSTWTMNRQNVLDLMAILDAGKIGKCRMLTGTYFKRRESAVYAQLITGLTVRGQKYVAFNNHTKIALLHRPEGEGRPAAWIVFEGSANWTANPRLENYAITNDEALYRFHQGWMDEMLRLSKDGESTSADFNFKTGEK
jgi:hypothetical protein